MRSDSILFFVIQKVFQDRVRCPFIREIRLPVILVGEIDDIGGADLLKEIGTPGFTSLA